jgi:hypothetical protein
LDEHTNEALWVGHDNDSLHTPRIYWKGKNKISVERNIKFVSPTIDISLAMPNPSPRQHTPEEPLPLTSSSTPHMTPDLEPNKSDDDKSVLSWPTTPVQTSCPLETPPAPKKARPIEPE